MIDINPYHPEDEDYLPFQKGGIQEMFIRNNILLGDEMGVGKTIQIIGYINLSKPGKVIIVCPNNLRLNWLAELDKWLDPELKAKYDIEQCTTTLYVPSNFIVASYEGLTKWGAVLKKMNPDLLVADEAHYIKNKSSQRCRALYLFQDIQCKKILATGTPICNFPYEVFPLIHFLDPVQWPSASAFESRYCPSTNRFGYHLPELQDYLRNGAFIKVRRAIQQTKLTRTAASTLTTYKCEERACSFEVLSAVDAEAHATEKMHTIRAHKIISEKIIPSRAEPVVRETMEKGIGLMIRRLKKEVLKELPRKRRQIIELPAEGELLKLVEEENAMWKKAEDILKVLNDALGTGPGPEAKDDESFESMIESLKFTKRYFFDEIAIIRHKLALAKVPYVGDHIEDLLENKDKLVCFVHHNDVGKALYDRFKDTAVLVYGATPMEERQTAIKKFWEDDACNLFIGSLKVTGVGLNLQVAANIVFAELDWVPGVITQAEDRCHRIGQEKSLLVQHLVAQNSMDSNMAKRIVAKQKSIQKALNRGKDD